MCLGRIGKQIDQNVFVDCCFVVCLPSRPSMSEVPCRKRDDYLEWPEYFMAVAFLSAQRSKDPNSQVGACIVNAENKIVGIGYNGMPNGCSDDLLPWRRTAENILDTKYPYGRARCVFYPARGMASVRAYQGWSESIIFLSS